MKKEKMVKAHSRRTKSGKPSRVKAHSSKYEVKGKDSKKGAGKEMSACSGKKKKNCSAC